MIHQFFLASSSVQPARRWSTAFPDGIAAERADILAHARDGDLIWVATAIPDWRDEIARLGRGLPACPIVAISLLPDADEGMRALDSGARGYCHALAAPELFREVAEVLRLGGLWVGPELMRRVVGAARREFVPEVDEGLGVVLSPRELEVARAAANGATNREIAAALGITERTVKAHMGAVFEKLGVRDRLQLVLRLSRQGAPVQVG